MNGSQYILIGIVAAFLAGCGHPTPTLDETRRELANVGDGLAKAEALLQRAKANLETAERITAGAAQATVGAAKGDVEAAHTEVAAANAAYEAALSELSKVSNKISALRARIKEIEESWWSPRQKRLFWWIVGGMALMAALRGLGLLFTGGVGSIFSFLGTTVGGVLSGGVSLVQSLFDNLWFRCRRPAPKASL